MRTKQPTVNATQKKPEIAVMSEMLNRVNLMQRMGTYNGDRNIYDALGYPTGIITYKEYFSRYLRQDIAKAVIDRPVQSSWKGEIVIMEANNNGKDTPFETAWKKLAYDHKLKSLFIRADKLTGIGRYSVILFGMNDISKLEDYAKPINKKRKSNKLLYLKPLSEESAKIEKFDNDPKSERYGLPLLYSVTVNDISTQAGNANLNVKTIQVHYSRLLHIVEDILENETYGTPRLQAIYNRLIDLDKIVGGDAEMYWRGARPGYTGNVDSEYQMSPETLSDLRTQIEEFEHNLKRVLINEGVEYKALAQQIAEPSSHVDVQIQLISAETGIPKRILVGSERGELSSSQDKQEYISFVTSRREETNEPMLLRPFIEKCMDLAILPTISYFQVVWDKLFSLSDKEKVMMGKDRSMAVRDYIANPVSIKLLPIEVFLKYILAFDDNQIEEIMLEMDEAALEEIVMKSIEAGVKQKELSAGGEVEKEIKPIEQA